MKKASTVLMIRDSDEGIEFLLLKRSEALKVLGGYWVFPGGKLDDEDQGQDVEDRMLAAAMREVREETGVSVQKTSLIPFARWQTPQGIPQRFDTAFYLTQCDAKMITIDDSEIVDYQWMSSTQALMAHQKGLADMMPPTVVSLIKIGQYSSVAEALYQVKKKPLAFYSPQIQEHDGGTVMVYNHDDSYQSEDSDSLSASKGRIDRCTWQNNHWEYQTNIESYEVLASS